MKSEKQYVKAVDAFQPSTDNYLPAAMNKVWVIAKREFRVTVTRKGYIFAVVGMPVLWSDLWHQLSHEWQPGTIHQVRLRTNRCR